MRGNKMDVLPNGRNAPYNELVALRRAELALHVPSVASDGTPRIELEDTDGAVTGDRALEVRSRRGEVDRLVRAIVARDHVTNTDTL